MDPATLPGQPKEDEELVPTPPAQPLADGKPSGRRASNAPPHTPSSPATVGAPHTATGADAAGAADDVAPASGDRHEDTADDIEQWSLLVAEDEAPVADLEPAPQPGAEQPHSEEAPAASPTVVGGLSGAQLGALAVQLGLREEEGAGLLEKTELNLRGKRLASLPAEIGQLQQLTTLNLSNNKLASLPAEIGQLQQLTELHLDDNELASLLPEIGQLQQLTTLYLDDNELASLPPEIGQLQQLTTLDLSNNELASLPPEIGQLRHGRAKVVATMIHLVRSIDFHGIDLDGFDLSSTNLQGANLNGAKLCGTRLVGANLYGVDLSGVDLSGADLTDANLSGATITAETVLEGAILVGTDFKGVDLTDIDLSGWTLTGAKLGHVLDVDFAKIDLAGIDLSGISGKARDVIIARFADESELDLTGISLRGADLTDCVLKNCTFKDADLRGTIFKGATLERVSLEGATVFPFKPPPKLTPAKEVGWFKGLLGKEVVQGLVEEAGAEIVEELDLEAAMEDIADEIGEDIGETMAEAEETYTHMAETTEAMLESLETAREKMQAAYTDMLTSVDMHTEKLAVEATKWSILRHGVQDGTYMVDAVTTESSSDAHVHVEAATAESTETHEALNSPHPKDIKQAESVRMYPRKLALNIKMKDRRKLIRMRTEVVRVLTHEVHELLSDWKRRAMKQIKSAGAGGTELEETLADLTMNSAVSAAQSLVEEAYRVLLQQCAARVEKLANKAALKCSKLEQDDVKDDEAPILFEELKLLVNRLGSDLARQLETKLAGRLLCFGSTLVNRVRGGVETLSELQHNAERFEETLRLTLVRKQGASLDPTTAKWLAACDVEIEEAEAKLKGERKKLEDKAEWYECTLVDYRKAIPGDFVEFDAAQVHLDDRKAKKTETEQQAAKELQSPYLSKGKLGEMVCIDRVRTILDGVTEYTPSRGNCCTRLFSMARRVIGHKRSVMTQHENELGYLNERLAKLELMHEAVTELNMYDLIETWVMLLSLRSKITTECGHAVLDSMIQDEDFLAGIGLVHQITEATLDAAGTKEMLKAIQQGGVSKLLKNNAYEYRRTLDAEIERIKRLKELQVRAVALSGSAVVAGLIGAANLLARVIYAQHFADSGGE
eukprot:COSAG06_NODE_411_length_16063_cov_12.216738_16_plen_1127_part_00